MSISTLRKLAGPLLACVLFGMAVWLLYGKVKDITWDEFMAGLTGVPPAQIAIAAILIAMNYVLLMTYDLLALRYIAKSIPLRRVALVSISGFSLGNNLGTLVAGAPIRFRFYSMWGLRPTQIVALISILGLTFWSGWWFLGGMVLIWVPLQIPPDVWLPVSTRAIGWFLLGLGLTYASVCFLWRKPWPIGKLHLRPPTPGLMFAQATVAAVDLLISSTALYLVLPVDAAVPFAQVLAAFMLAIGVAMMSQVPGGLGVLEAILLTLLEESVGKAEVLASVLMFRVLYYWLPLLCGMTCMAGFEIYGGAQVAIEASKHPELEDLSTDADATSLNAEADTGQIAMDDDSVSKNSDTRRPSTDQEAPDRNAD